MASRGLLVRRWSFILITLLSLPSALSDRVVEKLFFKSPVSDSGSRRAVQAREDVILECEAAGRPSPTIYWEYDGVRLSPTSESVGDRSLETIGNREQNHPLELGSTKARLFIDCAQPSDAGLYTCVAETPSKRISTTTYLDVESRAGYLPSASASIHCMNGGGQRAAHISMWTSMMLGFEGTNAVLFCRATGNPPPTVTWFDPYDHHITSSSNHNQYLITESGDLVIRDVMWQKNMGLYKCYAHNSEGSDFVEAFLYPTTVE